MGEKGLIWLTVHGMYHGEGSGQLELAATGHAVFTIRGRGQWLHTAAWFLSSFI